MVKRTPLIILVIASILLSGCQPVASIPVYTPVVTQESLPSNTPEIVYMTATPFSPAEGEVTPVSPFATPTPSFAAPTATTGTYPITITGLDDRGNGSAIIHWEANGDFPSGFQVVWSSTHENPTFPEDNSTFTNDSTARAAMIGGKTGTIYYARVCSYANDSCSDYSNVYIFSLKYIPPTSTKSSGYYYYTSTPKSYIYNEEGTQVSSENSLAITKIVDAGTGKAHIYWSASGSFTRGFQIVYSKSDTTPTFDDDSRYAISSSSTRDAYIDGAKGTKYYYRICRYTGSTCDIYSATYTFTFAGTKLTNTPDPAEIEITSINATSVGHALVTWETLSGVFPDGFKIVYSKTDSTPTLSDKYVTISSSSARTGTITGTAGATYYVRVCKYYDSICAAYSPMETFTFPAATATTDPAAITLLSVADGALGKAVVSWSATGSFPSGLYLMYSINNNPPDPGSDTPVTLTNLTGSYTVSGIPGTTYHFALCKVVSGDCGKYSNVITFTLAADTSSTLTNLTATDVSSENAKLDWSSSGIFADDIRVLRSTSHTSPTVSDSIGTISGTLTTTTISGTPGTTYYYRLCKVWGSSCSVYSDPVTFTFAEVTISSIADNGDGTATVNWTSKGNVDNGFLIVQDDTNNPPDPATDTVASPDKNKTPNGISGTIGTTYHILVCQSNGSGGCLVESDVKDFTFSSLSITAATESPAGTGHFTWDKAGDFSHEIALIYSMEKAVTTIGGADGYLVLGSTSTGTDINTSPSVVPGTTMHYRVCQLLTSSTCGIYSSEVTIAYTAEVSAPSFTDGTGEVTLDWTTSGASPTDGWAILRGDGSTDPIHATTLGASSTLSYTDSTISSGSSYTYRVCGLDGPYYTSCSAATGYTAP